MRLLPVLKPAQWDGPSTGAHAHVWIGTRAEPEVYVGYAWDSSDGLVYATPTSCEPHDGDEVVRQAFATLDEYEADFELVEVNESRVLVSAGHPSAAELVLTERFMLRVHDALEAEEVVVSVAKRGSMLACARDCPPEARTTLVNLHREAWLNAADDQRITNQLVVFKAGTKTTTMDVYGDGTVKAWE